MVIAFEEQPEYVFEAVVVLFDDFCAVDFLEEAQIGGFFCRFFVLQRIIKMVQLASSFDVVFEHDSDLVGQVLEKRRGEMEGPDEESE